jgi:hypothetical protein
MIRTAGNGLGGGLLIVAVVGLGWVNLQCGAPEHFNGGATGTAGASGIAGASASAGAVGSAGDVGSAGAVGSAGDVGSAGASPTPDGSTDVPTGGAAGATGSAGANGTAGAVGTAGASGTAGATGSAGANGSAGAVGTAGASGTAGAVGTAGASGTAGATGTGGATSMVCMNSTVKTAGGAESKCTVKTTWVATAMPTPASGLDGISNTLLQPQYAIDGSTTTRYSSGATMAPGFYFQVDLGAAKLVSGITVDTSEGSDVTDVAQAYEVDLSTDGTTFTKVASCLYPAAPMETINFTATMARYVRYINNAPAPTGKTSWLSIHEFDILCN